MAFASHVAALFLSGGTRNKVQPGNVAGLAVVVGVLGKMAIRSR